MFSAVVGLNMPVIATASRGKVLVVMSGPHLLVLKEGKDMPLAIILMNFIFRSQHW
jgi:hypothetical protein